MSEWEDCEAEGHGTMATTFLASRRAGVRTACRSCLQNRRNHCNVIATGLQRACELSRKVPTGPTSITTNRSTLQPHGLYLLRSPGQAVISLLLAQTHQGPHGRCVAT